MTVTLKYTFSRNAINNVRHGIAYFMAFEPTSWHILSATNGQQQNKQTHNNTMISQNGQLNATTLQCSSYTCFCSRLSVLGEHFLCG